MTQPDASAGNSVESFDLPIAPDTAGAVLLAGVDVALVDAHVIGVSPYLERDGVRGLAGTIGEIERALGAWVTLCAHVRRKYPDPL